MRLLLVEDETAIRSALTRGLAHDGTEVRPVASLKEAREAIAEQAPQALLSDLKLPDGSGLDLACELGVPFILMSGYATYDDAVQAMRMGCVDFFTKPVSIKDLRRAVGRLQALTAKDSLQVVDAAPQPRLARASALGVVVQPFSAQAWSWTSREEAERQFPAVVAEVSDPAVRQVLSELMQATEHGRLVVNLGDTWLSAWLDARIDWQEAQRERRLLIEDLCERSVWRADGALVECSHG
jgi:CheY-like chemotaxis protein